MNPYQDVNLHSQACRGRMSLRLEHLSVKLRTTVLCVRAQCFRNTTLGRSSRSRFRHGRLPGQIGEENVP